MPAIYRTILKINPKMKEDNSQDFITVPDSPIVFLPFFIKENKWSTGRSQHNQTNVLIICGFIGIEKQHESWDTDQGDQKKSELPVKAEKITPKRL